MTVPTSRLLRAAVLLTLTAALVMAMVPPAGAQLFGPKPVLDRIDQREPKLDRRYQPANDGAGVNVYVVDSGIRTTHREFEGRASIAYDAVGDPGEDCYGSGTFNAGLIGGRRYGVADAVRLHGVRILQCNGFGQLDEAVEGLDWVTANHVKPAVAFINLGDVVGSAADTLDAAVRRLIAAGVTVVVPSGGPLTTRGVGVDAADRSPSRVEEAVTVGGMAFWGTPNDQRNAADRRVGYTNYGTVIDLMAPVSNIGSAGIDDDRDFSAFYFGSGRGAAIVTGAAAMHLRDDPGATPAQVHAALVDNATVGAVANGLEEITYELEALRGTPNRMVYVGPPDTPTRNHVFNGGFEIGADSDTTSADGWYHSDNREGLAYPRNPTPDFAGDVHQVAPGTGRTGAYALTYRPDDGAGYRQRTFQRAWVTEGTYDLSLWLRSSGGQDELLVSVEDLTDGRTTELALPTEAIPGWTRYELPGLDLHGGLAELSIWSVAPAGGVWLDIDDVALTPR